MRVSLLCNSSLSLPFQPPRCHSSKPPLLSNHSNSGNWVNKTLIGVVSGALSLGLLVIPPTSIALEASSIQSPPSSSSSGYCREEELVEERAEAGSDSVVTNEGIVEEAWEIVNESFLGAGRHRWSTEDWQVWNVYMYAPS